MSKSFLKKALLGGAVAAGAAVWAIARVPSPTSAVIMCRPFRTCGTRTAVCMTPVPA